MSLVIELYKLIVWYLNNEDFASFIDELVSMFRSLSGQARLCTFDNRCLTLTIDQVGHTTVEIADGVDGYDGYVHVIFDIDQTYLSGLIQQL